MKTISTHYFKHTLSDIHKNSENRKFCFVIGAGASYNSGIQTGGEMAEEWFKEIENRLDENELIEWQATNHIDKDDLAASYGSIYRKRFENDKNSGYEYLVQAMKKSKPSFGHFVLSQILSRYAGHCVLTTNFDSLVESSVYQFTNKTPLVCGHESLSGYARPSQTHPLIIKVHRDLLLAPKSDPDEIRKLDPGWNEPLDHIFSTHIPIIIGYGGNDGSLMSYFKNMNRPSNFFWCGLNEKNVSEEIKQLVVLHGGRFVKIDGFDELMHELLLVFDEIQPIDKELNEITSKRIETAKIQLETITQSKEKSEILDIATEDREKIAKKEFSALEYDNHAKKEENLEKRKKIYLEALEKYPSTAWLWWEFTYFLHFIKKDYTNLDQYYERAVELNKSKSGLISNYAIFLEKILNKYDPAEEYYKKSLELDSNDAINNGNYALFLERARKKYDQAEKYYKIALELDSNNVINNGNYALFLERARKKYDQAEKYFKNHWN